MPYIGVLFIKIRKSLLPMDYPLTLEAGFTVRIGETQLKKPKRPNNYDPSA